MIGFLKGEIAGIYEEQILLDVHDIGYNIKVSSTTLEMLGGIGETVKIYTYLSVREDAMQLYGFLTKNDLDFFKLLIQVNGIGPKGALSILSVMNTDDLRFAIFSGDAKTISKAPGVGAKTAQRLIIDLKDKVSFEDAFEERLNRTSKSGQSVESPLHAAKNEAVEALTALGYSQTESLQAVRQVEIKDDSDVEYILKQALKIMVKH
ncbi:MAG: Holliday junction branch migration protein RuvA [Clostridia bacterium]|nr:Holliday junction branch migration protein RuvA [Clostridia bacterium]